MKDYIAARALELAGYITETKATVRDAGETHGISKSTVHKDVTERLKELDAELYKKVKKILELNLSQRHIRGGLATREKYKNNRH